MTNWKDGIARQALPIDGYLPQILELWSSGHQVVIVQAETGAGKTIRLPQAHLLRDPNCRVTMTQTRRNAVRWNGKRIAWEMGCDVGGLVGWRLFGEEPKVSRDTRLTLVIDQSLANEIRRREGVLPAGLLIIDEAHERSVSTDLLLGLIKEGLSRSPQTRVLITSATIDTEKFSRYFDGALVVTVPGRCFPISTEVVRLQKFEHHSEGASRACELVLGRWFADQLEIPSADGQSTQPVNQGAVICLLPGKEDITQVMKSIQRKAESLRLEAQKEVASIVTELLQKGFTLPAKLVEKQDRWGDKVFSAEFRVEELLGWCEKNQSEEKVLELVGLLRKFEKLNLVEVYSCHGESSPEEQDAIQEPLRNGAIRFVCGTEILRTSVTVREAIGVIDSLQVKRLVTDAKGVAHLDKIAISRAEADQGKGRAGRTHPGFYIPISFESEYERLQPHPTPAILREPLANICLQIADMGMTARTFPFLDAPNQEKVSVALRRLQRIGALDDEERITETGELLVQFPVDPERAKMLVTGDRYGVLAETVVVAAVLEAEGIFYHPRPEDKILVDRRFVSSLLSQYEVDSWRGIEKRYEAVPEESVDFSKLPEGITPKGKMFEIDAQKLRADNGVRWFADRQRQEWAQGKQNDFVAMVNAYRAFKAEERRLKNENRSRREQENSLFEWCKSHFLNAKKLRQAEFIMHQIKEELYQSPLRLENGLVQEREFDHIALTKSLASGLVDNVAVKSGREYEGALGEFTLAYQSSAYKANAEVILVGGVRKIPGKGSRGRTTLISLADIGAPLEISWLSEVMPQLCEKKRQSNHQYDSSQDQVIETEQYFFTGLTLGEKRIPSVDKEASTHAFASWLASEVTR